MYLFLYQKAESLVSHEPSEIILICYLGAQKPFLIINVENSCAA